MDAIFNNIVSPAEIDKIALQVNLDSKDYFFLKICFLKAEERGLFTFPPWGPLTLKMKSVDG